MATSLVIPFLCLLLEYNLNRYRQSLSKKQEKKGANVQPCLLDCNKGTTSSFLQVKKPILNAKL